MKQSDINLQIEYIKRRLSETNSKNISIMTGRLTETQSQQLSKHFKITKQPFSYTKFEVIK